MSVQALEIGERPRRNMENVLTLGYLVPMMLRAGGVGGGAAGDQGGGGGGNQGGSDGNGDDQGGGDGNGVGGDGNGDGNDQGGAWPRRQAQRHRQRGLLLRNTK